jgi:hypothetical protein
MYSSDFVSILLVLSLQGGSMNYSSISLTTLLVLAS